MSIFNFFKRDKFEQISPVSQPHEMIIMLLQAYPKPIPTWEFNEPSIGIMNQWEVCRVLREYGAIISTKQHPHVNKFGRNIVVSSYVLTEKQSGIDVERKLRDSKRNKIKE